MEFLAGVVATLFLEFIGYKIVMFEKRRRIRKTYVPPSGSPPSGRPIKDYPEEPR
jgi:hypothetical protein